MVWPEHEKLKSCVTDTQAAGDFITWCEDEKGIRLARMNGDRMTQSLTELLAEWKGIDLDEVEREKRAMLDGLAEADALGRCEAYGSCSYSAVSPYQCPRTGVVRYLCKACADRRPTWKRVEE